MAEPLSLDSPFPCGAEKLVRRENQTAAGHCGSSLIAPLVAGIHVLWWSHPGSCRLQELAACGQGTHIFCAHDADRHCGRDRSPQGSTTSPTQVAVFFSRRFR